MRDEKEERKKQARSNKQTRQSNTAHPTCMCTFLECSETRDVFYIVTVGTCRYMYFVFMMLWTCILSLFMLVCVLYTWNLVTMHVYM